MHPLKKKIVTFWAGCVMLLRKLNGERAEIVVATPGTAGSLGDQALMQGLWDGLARPEGAQLRQILLPGYDRIPTDPVGLPPVGIANYSFLGDLKFLWSLRNARLFCVLGADVMDGVYDRHQALAYLHFSDLAVRAGVAARIFGFSFSSRPHPEVVDRFKALSPEVTCCVRDPGSLERFERMTGRKGLLVADLAFLLDPEIRAPAAQAMAAWMVGERRAGAGKPRFVAVNANALNSQEKQEVIVASFADLVEKLAAQHADLRFLLLPHDFRSERSDAAVSQAIHARLQPATQARACVLAPPFDAWDAKALVAECDLLVTGRMHLAVAALGTGTPVIMAAMLSA